MDEIIFLFYFKKDVKDYWEQQLELLFKKKKNNAR